MAASLYAPVTSTCLTSVFYHGDTQELTVQFAKGSSYTYSGVPEAVAQGLVDASSKGKYMHAHILGAYAYRKG